MLTLCVWGGNLGICNLNASSPAATLDSDAWIQGPHLERLEEPPISFIFCLSGILGKLKSVSQKAFNIMSFSSGFLLGPAIAKLHQN